MKESIAIEDYEPDENEVIDELIRHLNDVRTKETKDFFCMLIFKENDNARTHIFTSFKEILDVLATTELVEEYNNEMRKSLIEKINKIGERK